MNFRQLEYVLTIYREGSVRKAAAKLFISQPALSQQLQKVEEELGTPIFDRSTTPIRPTHAGRYYLDTIERILFEQQQAMNRIHDLSQYKLGKISFGIALVRSCQFLPIILPAFQKQYSHIQVELHEGPALSLPVLMERGEIDFSLMIAQADCPGFTFLPLVKEHVLLAVPPDSHADQICHQSMEQNGYIDMKLLKDEPFILLKHGYRLHLIAGQIFENYKISPPVILKTIDVQLSHKLSGAGYGLSFVGEIAARLSDLPVKPHYYPLSEPGCSWVLGIAYHPNKYVTKAMKAFFEVARQQLASYPLHIC